jgi:acyl-coenzyme A thioesterase PaaI-like protein
MSQSLILFESFSLIFFVFFFQFVQGFIPLKSGMDQRTFGEKQLISGYQSSLLSWFQDLKDNKGGKAVTIREWVDEAWRRDPEGGAFSGTDFCHSVSASVRIIDYLLFDKKSAEILSKSDIELDFPFLIGATHFTEKSESHRGLCHGGSFCALMDDAIGWLGFCVSGEVKPWSGYTVQVNTALKKSVKVGSILKLESWVKRKEGTRKYWIESRLVNPETGEVHCEAEGLFLLSPEMAESSF